MSSPQITTSAALYFAPQPCGSIPLHWFERARELFADYSLSPILFTASGGTFLQDDCYVLGERGEDLVKWGEALAARRRDLIDALRNGVIESLGLDSPRPGAEDRSDWRTNVSVFARSGECYIGLDEDFVPEPFALLRRARDITTGVFDIRYGIAYKSPLAQYPDG